MLVSPSEVFKVGHTLELVGCFPTVSSTPSASSSRTTTRTAGHRSRAAEKVSTNPLQERIEVPSASSTTSMTPYQICISAMACVGGEEEGKECTAFPPTCGPTTSFAPLVIVGSTTGDLLGFQPRYAWTVPASTARTSTSSCSVSSAAAGSAAAYTITEMELLFFLPRYHHGPIYAIALDTRSFRVATGGHDGVCRLTSSTSLAMWCRGHVAPLCVSSHHTRNEGVRAAAAPLPERDHPADTPLRESEVAWCNGVFLRTSQSGVFQFRRCSSATSIMDEAIQREEGVLPPLQEDGTSTPRVGGSPREEAVFLPFLSAIGKPPHTMVHLLGGHTLPVVKLQFTLNACYLYSLSVEGHLREHDLRGLEVEQTGNGWIHNSGGRGEHSLPLCFSPPPAAAASATTTWPSIPASRCPSTATTRGRDFFCQGVLPASSPTSLSLPFPWVHGPAGGRRLLMHTFALSPDEMFAVVAGESIEWIDLRRQSGGHGRGEASSTVERQASPPFPFFSSSAAFLDTSPHATTDKVANVSTSTAKPQAEDQEEEGPPKRRRRMWIPAHASWWRCIEQHAGNVEENTASTMPQTTSPLPLPPSYRCSSLCITSLRWRIIGSGAVLLPPTVAASSHAVSPAMCGGCLTYQLVATVVEKQQHEADLSVNEPRVGRPCREGTQNTRTGGTSPTLPSTAFSSSSRGAGAADDQRSTTSPAGNHESPRPRATRTTLPTWERMVTLGALVWTEPAGGRVPLGKAGEEAPPPLCFLPSVLHPEHSSPWPLCTSTETEHREEEEDGRVNASAHSSTPTTSPLSFSFSSGDGRTNTCHHWVHQVKDHVATAALCREIMGHPALSLSSASSLPRILRRRGHRCTTGEVAAHLQHRKRQLHNECNDLFKKLKAEVITAAYHSSKGEKSFKTKG